MLSEERSEEGRGSAAYAYWTRVMGDPAADRAELIAVSQARQAQNIRAPELLIHGEDDWVAPIESSAAFRSDGSFSLAESCAGVRYQPAALG